jgi:20S proteasome alpha/beta subunit
VTVCIAGLFDWNYAKTGEDFGRAGFLLSDRMITAGDVQYEPRQRKWAEIASNITLAIAGDISTHSQALKDTHAQLRGDRAPAPYDVASIYGRAIQSIKRRKAEDLYLAPLGLNTDTLLVQTKEMSDSVTNALLERMQSHRGDDVEALLLGMSQPVGARQPLAQIYTIDSDGVVNCCDDVGFAAIGIGGWHARSRMMQSGYTNTFRFSAALAVLYAAKKAAEIAPGVGRDTDIQMMTRDGGFPLWPEMQTKLETLYKQYDQERDQIAVKAIMALNDSLGEFGKGATDAKAPEPTGADKKTDGGPSATTAEAARENEAGPIPGERSH